MRFKILIGFEKKKGQCNKTDKNFEFELFATTFRIDEVIRSENSRLELRKLNSLIFFGITDQF